MKNNKTILVLPAINGHPMARFAMLDYMLLKEISPGVFEEYDYLRSPNEALTERIEAYWGIGRAALATKISEIMACRQAWADDQPVRLIHSPSGGMCIEGWRSYPYVVSCACGGSMRWDEAGRVPGARKCDGCGSAPILRRIDGSGERPIWSAK